MVHSELSDSGLSSKRSKVDFILARPILHFVFLHCGFLTFLLRRLDESYLEFERVWLKLRKFNSLLCTKMRPHAQPSHAC